jgi:hypothetical protein
LNAQVRKDLAGYESPVEGKRRLDNRMPLFQALTFREQYLDIDQTGPDFGVASVGRVRNEVGFAAYGPNRRSAALKRLSKVRQTLAPNPKFVARADVAHNSFFGESMRERLGRYNHHCN